MREKVVKNGCSNIISHFKLDNVSCTPFFSHTHCITPCESVCETQKVSFLCVWGPRRHMSQLYVGVQVVHVT